MRAFLLKGNYGEKEKKYKKDRTILLYLADCINFDHICNWFGNSIYCTWIYQIQYYERTGISWIRKLCEINVGQQIHKSIEEYN